MEKFDQKETGSTRRKEQAARTKARLYETADRLFQQYGYDTVSVDAIVEAAGVSKGAFYVYFESKDALASALIADHVNRVDMDYQAFLDGLPPGQSVADNLLALVDKIFDVLEGHVGCARMRMLYKSQLVNAEHTQKASSYSRALYSMLHNVLEGGIRRGEFRSTLSAEEGSRLLLLAMRGLTYEWCIRYPDYDVKTQARQLFTLLLEGIRSRD